MSKKHQEPESDKSERVMKHERSHKDVYKNLENELQRLEPKHKPMKKKTVNILDAYEKFGDEYDGRDN